MVKERGDMVAGDEYSEQRKDCGEGGVFGNIDTTKEREGAR